MKDVVAMLIAHECIGGNIPLIAYPDTVGKMTIGVGHNLEDKPITKDVALAILNDDIIDAMIDVKHCFSVYDELSRPRQLVLINMAFNMGRTRLGKFVRFISAVHREDWDDAADEMLNSKWAKDVGNRAEVLAKMMRENVSPWV